MIKWFKRLFGVTYIQKVEIIIKGNDDPTRIARLVVKHLQDLNQTAH